MNRNEENGFHQTQVVEEPSEQITGGPPPSENGNVPYVPQKEMAKQSLKDNSRLLIIGAGIVLVLLLLAFNGISRRSAAPKTSGANSKQPFIQAPNSDRAPASITPILDTGRSPAQETDGSLVNPDQIAHTATRLAKPTPGTTLGSVPPFDNRQVWLPAPFQPGSQTADVGASTAIATDATETKNQHDAMDKASLVFVRNNPSSASSAKSPDTATPICLGYRIAAGHKIAGQARIPSEHRHPDPSCRGYRIQL